MEIELHMLCDQDSVSVMLDASTNLKRDRHGAAVQREVAQQLSELGLSNKSKAKAVQKKAVNQCCKVCSALPLSQCVLLHHVQKYT